MKTDIKFLHRHTTAGARTHRSVCYCGKRAAFHIGTGSGCGNVCKAHKTSIVKTSPGVNVSPPIIEET